MITIVLGIPLLVWHFLDTQKVLPDLVFKIYLMTGSLFGIALAGEYPPIQSVWFRRFLLTIGSIHLLLIACLVVVELQWFNTIKLPARALYELLLAVVVGEWMLALKILKSVEPGD